MDERTGADIEVHHRLQWVADARAGKFEHISASELDKYLVSQRKNKKVIQYRESL